MFSVYIYTKISTISAFFNELIADRFSFSIAIEGGIPEDLPLILMGIKPEVNKRLNSRSGPLYIPIRRETNNSTFSYPIIKTVKRYGDLTTPVKILPLLLTLHQAGNIPACESWPCRTRKHSRQSVTVLFVLANVRSVVGGSNTSTIGMVPSASFLLYAR